MGVVFSKPKKSEESRSRSNSLISLQNVNTREPGAGAEENQILLQANLNSGYESTVVAIPAERNTQVAENSKTENYFLSLPIDVANIVFSFCPVRDRVSIGSTCHFFHDIMLADIDMPFSHAISMLSDMHLFSCSCRFIMLLTGSPTTTIPQVRYNPFYDTKDLHTLLKNLLDNDISDENAMRLKSILLKMEQNMQTPVKGIGIGERLLYFLASTPRWVRISLFSLMIFLVYYFAGVIKVPAMIQVSDEKRSLFTQLPCSFMFKNKAVEFYPEHAGPYDYNYKPFYYYENFTQFMFANNLGNYILSVRNACETAFHFLKNQNNIINMHPSDLFSIIVYNCFDWHDDEIFKSDHFKYSSVSAIEFAIIFGFVLSLIGSLLFLILIFCDSFVLKGEAGINKLAQLHDHVQFFKDKLNPPPTEEASKQTDSIPVPIPT